jgi:hypothetical protein
VLPEDFTARHRHYSIIAFWIVWSNLWRMAKKNPQTIEKAGVKIVFFPPRPWMWLVLPQLLFHESLHFVLGFFTGNRNIVRLLPPLLDLGYLISPILVIHGAVTNLVLALWLFLGSWILLRGNLRGDFRPYLLAIADRLIRRSTIRRELRTASSC